MSNSNSSSRKKEAWGDTEHWIKEFEGVDLEALSQSIDSDNDASKEGEDEGGDESDSTIQKETFDSTFDSSLLAEIEKDNIPELDDIFPPEYGEDLLDETDEA